MSYLLLKHLHVSCVVLSGLGFLWRAWLMLRSSPRLQQPLARIAPHLIDTLLLGSALSMAVISHQYPFVHAWLTAKFFGLLAYILCGTLALKRGKTRQGRLLALLGAIAAYAYIVGVALTRSPLPFSP